MSSRSDDAADRPQESCTSNADSLDQFISWPMISCRTFTVKTKHSGSPLSHASVILVRGRCASLTRKFVQLIFWPVLSGATRRTYSTVTLLARFRGRSTLQPRSSATW